MRKKNFLLLFVEMQKVIDVDGNYAASVHISWNGSDFVLTVPQ
jgi:hypothetical protein